MFAYMILLREYFSSFACGLQFSLLRQNISCVCKFLCTTEEEYCFCCMIVTGYLINSLLLNHYFAQQSLSFKLLLFEMELLLVRVIQIVNKVVQNLYFNFCVLSLLVMYLKTEIASYHSLLPSELYLTNLWQVEHLRLNSIACA